MNHFKDFMMSSVELSTEYLLKQDRTAVEKEFLTYFTVLALELPFAKDCIQHDNLEQLKGVPLYQKTDKFMQSARLLAEAILQKDNSTKAEASFITAFTLMALNNLNNLK